MLIKATLLFIVLVAGLAGVEFVGAKTLGYPPVLRFVMHDLPFMGERFDSDMWAAAGSCKGLDLLP